jgi:membrane protein
VFFVWFFVPFIVFCKNIVNEFLSRNGPHLAAAISFYALFSLFPLVLALITVLSFVLGSPASKAQLAQQIGDLVPVSEELVVQTISTVVGSRNISGVIAIVALLWATTAVFGAIRKGINTTWGIRQTRPFLQERAIDFSLAIGAGLLFLISISSTAALSFFRELAILLYPATVVDGIFAWDQVAAVIPPTLSLITFIVLYWFLPNTRVRIRHVWPVAILATVAFEVVKNGFVFFVQNYSDYNIVYGTIGAVFALLMWIYVSAIILLFCALLVSRYSAYMEERARTRRWMNMLESASSDIALEPSDQRRSTRKVA